MRVCKLRELDELLESVMSVLLVRGYKTIRKKRHREKPMTPCYIERRVRFLLADRYVAGSTQRAACGRRSGRRRGFKRRRNGLRRFRYNRTRGRSRGRNST